MALDTTSDTVLLDMAERLREQLVTDSSERLKSGQLGSAIREIVDSEAALLDTESRLRLEQMVNHLSFGLGPLDSLLGDGEVDEIMVNGPQEIWVERRGKLEKTAICFDSESQLRDTVDRILAPLGRRIDESTPLVDARMQDGSRVNVIIPPLSLNGTVLTVRRFRKRDYTLNELVKIGTVTAEVAEFLKLCVEARLNILVSGGTGSGKTTTLNALSGCIDSTQRIVTIEDTSELRLQQPHTLTLEARLANMEGSGEITIRDLLRNSLRMRPDRIVVGEVRGGEALDMVSAMCTGHDGSLSTVHAGSAEQAVRRVETLALMADVALPHAAIRRQVTAAIDLIVYQQRCGDGSRRVTGLAEVIDSDSGELTAPLYRQEVDAGGWRPPSSGRVSEKLGQTR